MKIEEIAKSLGVSKSTVSLAINNKPGISQETREKVLQIVKDSGYISRTMIKSSQKYTFNKTIRFLVITRPEIKTLENQISSSFFTELIHGLEKKCKVYGFLLAFSSIDLEDFEEQIKKTEEEHSPVGTILLGTNLTKSEIEIASRYINNLVILDTYFEFLNVNFLVMNNKMGGYKACSYLIELGHKNIGYVQSSHRISNFDFRKKGFMAAIKENNLNIPRENFFTVSNEINLAHSDFTDILQNHKGPLPGALFCESDYIAIGVIKALQEYGKKVPDDISVMGFDNVPESLIISPILTTIDVKKNEMGAIAAQRIFNIINSQENHTIVTTTIINTSLVVRNSCRALNTL